jgi:atypical dual specificity phosphatase
MALRSFYWLIEGALAGSGRPGGTDVDLDDDLAWLRAQGIAAVLSLTEAPLPAAALARRGLVGLHLPVPDLQPPSPEQLQVALGFIDEQRARGRAVLVHCLVGQGRTGTLLAAYLIRGGLAASEAIVALRRVCPDAIGAPTQSAALHEFAAGRGWLI